MCDQTSNIAKINDTIERLVASHRELRTSNAKLIFAARNVIWVFHSLPMGDDDRIDRAFDEMFVAVCELDAASRAARVEGAA